MKPDRWDKIGEIFDVAVSVPRDEARRMALSRLR